ncbi:MAG: lysophospholipid acyltransferase family protein, partial [Limisphaerales bacterium]
MQSSNSALEQQRAGRMTTSYWIGWSLFRLLFSLYFRWRVSGADKVPQTGSVILASNHASYLDPPLVGSAMKRMLNYMARETLFRFPIVGRIL